MTQVIIWYHIMDTTHTLMNDRRNTEEVRNINLTDINISTQHQHCDQLQRSIEQHLLEIQQSTQVQQSAQFPHQHGNIITSL